jgi:tripartite-type tricarboxylate transporter receptor subunit TctC
MPYRGGAPAIADLLGGQVQIYFGTLPATIEHIRAGTLRVLAVTSSTRFNLLPDIPTVDESVPGYEASEWFAIGLRRGTPAEIVNELSKEISAALGDHKMQGRFTDLGTTVVDGSSTDFEKFIVDETEKWAKVIRSANIKSD